MTRNIKRANTVTSPTEVGRVRLSKTFFMRDFLFFDIASIHVFNMCLTITI